MEKFFRNLDLPETQKELLRRQLEETTEKVVDKLLFELRDQAEQETLQRTIEILEKVYRI